MICLLLILLATPGAAQSRWQRLYPLPTPHGLAGATFANDLFVAVGYYNTILTSRDAVAWTARTVEGNAVLTDVAYGNGQFVAVGGPAIDCSGDVSSVVRTSTDGTTWTEQTPLLGFRLSRLVFANNLFIGLGTTEETQEGPSSVILTSSDGRNWIERFRGEGKSHFRYLYLVAEGNTVIALRRQLEGNVLTVSTNGINWSDVQVPFLGSGAWVSGVASGGGRFLAAAAVYLDEGLPDLAAWTSSDGVNWSQHSIKQNWLGGVGAIGFGRGEFVLLARHFDPPFEAIAFRSTDGQVWSERPATGLTLVESDLGVGIHTVARFLYANDQFVLIGQPQASDQEMSPGARVFTSPDGVNWTRRIGASRFGTSSVGDSLASNGSGFVAISVQGRQTRVRRSTNGLDWDDTRFLTNVVLSSIAYGHGMYIGVGPSGIFASPDGEHWTQQQPNTGKDWSKLRLSNGTFVTLGSQLKDQRQSFPPLGVSTNGRDWKLTEPFGTYSSAYFADVATDGTNLFVGLIVPESVSEGVSRGGSVLLRSNGSAPWTEVYRTSNTGNLLLAHGNGRFVALDGNAHIVPSDQGESVVLNSRTSTDGIVWTQHIAVESYSDISDLIFANGQFFAAAVDYCSQSFRILSSSDGVNWVPHPSSFFGFFGGQLIATPQTLIAFSAYNQTILQSSWDIILQGLQRLTNGTVGLQMLTGGRSVESIEIQVASKLSPPDWKTIPVAWDLSDAPIAYDSSISSGLQQRFYRALRR